MLLTIIVSSHEKKDRCFYHHIKLIQKYIKDLIFSLLIIYKIFIKFFRMKLKFGKCLNSINQCKIINFLYSLFRCFSTKDSAVVYNNKSIKNSSSKKYSFKKEFKLIYYTLCYNENNDTITTIETCFSPVAEYFSSFIRWFGRVNRLNLFFL